MKSFMQCNCKLSLCNGVLLITVRNQPHMRETYVCCVLRRYIFVNTIYHFVIASNPNEQHVHHLCEIVCRLCLLCASVFLSEHPAMPYMVHFNGYYTYE